jgi:inosose dehydratase
VTVKIAGAPISWGVCEVPGWGYQLGPDRVLTEMQQVGLAATELGPLGFLPPDPDRVRRDRLVGAGAVGRQRTDRVDTRPVRDGMYRPLGTGDVDVEAIVSALGKYGYSALRA